MVRERYYKVRTQKEKSLLLDEYCHNARQSGKYAIRKIHTADFWTKAKEEEEGKSYGGEVKTTPFKTLGDILLSVWTKAQASS